MSQVLLTLLFIALFVVAAVVIFAFYAGTRLMRAAVTVAGKQIEAVKKLVDHPRVGDEARTLHAQSETAYAAVPAVHFYNLKAVGRALAQVAEPLVKAAEKAHEELKTWAEGSITTASTYVDSVESQVKSEFGVDADLKASREAIDLARALVAGRKYDEADARASEATKAATAEYERVKAEKAGSPSTPPAQ